MKFLMILTALIVGSMIGLHTILQNGSLQHVLDNHPDPKIVPNVQYLVGHYHYFMGDLQQSATSFLRIAERYPQSDSADDAYYWYLQSLDDMNPPRLTMADLYQTYLDRFPQGRHTDMVSRRITFARSTR